MLLKKLVVNRNALVQCFNFLIATSALSVHAFASTLTFESTIYDLVCVCVMAYGLRGWKVKVTG